MHRTDNGNQFGREANLRFRVSALETIEAVVGLCEAGVGVLAQGVETPVGVAAGASRVVSSYRGLRRESP